MSRMMRFQIPQTPMSENLQKQSNYQQSNIQDLFLECQMCMNHLPKEEMNSFGQCNHQFCTSCLKDYLTFKIKSSTALINCPQESCKILINDSGPLFNGLVTPDLKKIHERNKLKHQILTNPSLRQCSRQECNGLIDRDIWKIQMKLYPDQSITCPTCNATYCKKCLEQFHEQQCNDQTIVDALEKYHKFRQCNKCKMVVERSQGCPHMKCKCGHQFCYNCGNDLKTHGENCVPWKPGNWNYLAIVKWQVEHSNMFYEIGIISFSRYLNCLDLYGRVQRLQFRLRVLYSVLYTLTLFPVSLGFFMALSGLILTGVLCGIIGLILFLPLLMFSKNPANCGFQTIQTLYRCFGYSGYVIFQVLLYPIVVILMVVELIYIEVRYPNLLYMLRRLLLQIGMGFRNILLMPVLLCVSSGPQ